jgi:hypothetical protein
MKPFRAFLIAICALAAAQTACAGEIVVRAINVTTGTGMKNCEVSLMGGPSGVAAQQQWLTGIRYLTTATDGRASFKITQQLPNFIQPNLGNYLLD